MLNLEEQRILIVDDNPDNIHILGSILNDYKRIIALNGESALKKAMAVPHPDLILLDVMMPGMDGYEVCKQLKSYKETKDIPIIFVTARNDEEDETRGLELGAVDYIVKPISASIVRARVKTHISLKLAKEALENQNALLEKKVQERTRELTMTQDATIYCMASLAETRDNETGGHIRRTQEYVKSLAIELSYHPEFQDQLDPHLIELYTKSAPLHDIGKVGVPDNILLKPGKLTPLEFEIMKKHTIYGKDAILAAEKILGTNSFLQFAREIAWTHHEKWDGSGYPRGLKQEEIPISGRFMAIADVYDALVSKRVYKPPFPHKKAVEIIKQGRGNHFQPLIVDVFLDLSETFRQIALEHADFDEERQTLS